MVTAGQIYDFIDSFAPFRNQDSFDNSGLSVGQREQEVSRVLLALDATVGVVDEAEAKNCQLILTHHPAMYDGVKRLDTDFPAPRALSKGIACLGCHTSLDSAPYGISDMMVDLLGFENLHVVPTINRKDPETGDPVGYGAMSRCPKMPPEKLAEFAGKKFKTAGLRWVSGGKDIEVVACGSGACSMILQDAKNLGAQAVITGDVGLHVFLDAVRLGMTLIDVGHYESEVISLNYLAARLEKELGLECIVSSTDRAIRGMRD